MSLLIALNNDNIICTCVREVDNLNNLLARLIEGHHISAASLSNRNKYLYSNTLRATAQLPHYKQTATVLRCHQMIQSLRYRIEHGGICSFNGYHHICQFVGDV